MLDKNMQLKFEEGSTTETLTIISAGLEELDFGSKWVVHIKPLITGHDHFLPSEGLTRKLKDENIDVGDQITIEKVAKSEKYPYGYFGVKVIDKVPMDKGNNSETKTVEPMHKSDQKFEDQFKQPIESNIDKHELSIRVEKLEKMVVLLMKWYGDQTSDAGHKPDDDKIPF